MFVCPADFSACCIFARKPEIRSEKRKVSIPVYAQVCDTKGLKDYENDNAYRKQSNM